MLYVVVCEKVRGTILKTQSWLRQVTFQWLVIGEHDSMIEAKEFAIMYPHGWYIKIREDWELKEEFAKWEVD